MDTKGQGKPMLSLLEPEFLFGMAEVMTYGVGKHGVSNWKGRGDDVDLIKDAMLRHALTKGNDKETGLSHLLHCACNLQFLYYFEKQGYTKRALESLGGK